ncbi:MAG: PQQ-binding-like beta-propeller repeat protein [Planctomycetota bacterium]
MSDAMGLALTGYAFQLARDPEQYTEALAEVDEKLDAVVQVLAAADSHRPWASGFIALHYCEEAARGKAVSEKLQSLVTLVEADQNSEGGWGHGQGDLSYPATLIAATNWCAVALGLCRRYGATVDMERARGAVRLYESVQGASGAMPYGGPTSLRIYEAGRTSGTLIGLTALGRTDSPVFARARRYVGDHLDDIGFGLHDPHQHLLAGAIAALLWTATDFARFRRFWVDELLRRQREDGSFACINPDTCAFCGRFVLESPGFGELYPTASTACILGLGRSRVLAKLRERERVWSLEIKTLCNLAACDGRMYVLSDQPPACTCRDTPTGNELWKVGLVAEQEQDLKLIPRVVWAEGEDVLVRLDPRLEPRRIPEKKACVLCLDAAAGTRRWEHWLEAGVRAVSFLTDRIAMLTSQGAGLEIVSRSTGEVLWQGPLHEGRVASQPESTITASQARVFVVGTFRHVVALAADGKRLWVRQAARAGTILSTPAVLSDRVIAGATDGSIVCWRIQDGTELWRTSGAAGVQYCVPVSLDEERLLVFTHDGVTRCLRSSDGQQLWSFAPAGLPEAHVGDPVVRSSPGNVWIHPAAKEELYQVSGDGALLATILLPPYADKAWCRTVCGTRARGYVWR